MPSVSSFSISAAFIKHHHLKFDLQGFLFLFIYFFIYLSEETCCISVYNSTSYLIRTTNIDNLKILLKTFKHLKKQNIPLFFIGFWDVSVLVNKRSFIYYKKAIKFAKFTNAFEINDNEITWFKKICLCTASKSATPVN